MDIERDTRGGGETSSGARELSAGTVTDYLDEDFDLESDNGSNMNAEWTHSAPGEQQATMPGGHPCSSLNSSVGGEGHYCVLSSEQVAKHQEEEERDTAELLGVERDEAFCLLRHFSWDKEKLQEGWFDDERKTREGAGIAPPSSEAAPPPLPHSDERCLICCETVPPEKLFSLGCGHWGCLECWKRYCEHEITEGRKAVSAKCCQYQCKRIVPRSVHERFVAPSLFQRYKEWVSKSYVDDNPVMRWCPRHNPEDAEPCHRAILCRAPSRMIDVECLCGTAFCFNCCNEPHRPASCKIVQDWLEKNTAESENVSWIIANTKKCPKCARAIEKNQGCNHMTCSKPAGGCGHEFCWLCMGGWDLHNTSTGGYYQCNLYEKASQTEKAKEEEATRQQAKHALEKYIHYYERFRNHEVSLRFVQRDEEKIDKKVQLLHEREHVNHSELNFLYEALKQVVKCRQVLKWSYACGYYLEEDREKHLFEFLQRNLEENCEHLHELIEFRQDSLFESLETDEPLDYEKHPREARYGRDGSSLSAVSGGRTGHDSTRSGPTPEEKNSTWQLSITIVDRCYASLCTSKHSLASVCCWRKLYEVPK